MKASIVLLLPVVISAAVVQPRQATPNEAKTYESKEAPRIRKNAVRKVTKIPLHLLAGNTGRHGMSLDTNGHGIMFNLKAGTFCDGKDCTILAGKAGLEYANGTQADPSTGVYIHHILSSNSKKTIEPFVSRCDSKTDVKRMARPAKSAAGFAGVSDDNGNEPIIYGDIEGKIEGGYWLRSTDTIGVWADLVNLHKEDKNILLTYDLEYLPGFVGTDSQGTLLSVTGCAARRINTSSKGAVNTTSNYFRFFRDGYLVNGKGHLHDGGVAMDLFINNKYKCSSNAVYGGDTHTADNNGKKWETISGMTICKETIEVKDGYNMSLVARYDLTKHPLRENGDHKMAEIMGMWTMNFIPKANSAPAVMTS